ncbi:centrosomal protein POC5 [Solea solea]|uniref:centrosomal protein POC5 n=1 Tax=Solea solea TaxID=90069 RepID=UPI00272C3240|nr:centrosomal protein POC5 [Solea solea]
MSSDEEERTSPVLPKDSDRGSSVSSELQDEYEELLRYAVVTSKYDTLPSSHLQQLTTLHMSAEGSSSQRRDGTKSQHRTDMTSAAKDGGHSSKTERSSQTYPLIVEPVAHSRASHMEEVSHSRLSVLTDTPLGGLQTPTERSRPNSPDPLTSTVMEMFVSEENMSKMEDILDTWSNNLKSNVLSELQKWKLSFTERHKLEMRKEKERCATRAAGLKAELDGLKGLLHTYETSNQRKDEVIMNLSQVLNRQKERLEKMRAFNHWRLQHTEAKEEAHAARLAQQHYNLQLKKKVWSGWHSLVQRHWKVKVEEACRARAEEVCAHLSTDYEARLAEHCEAIEKAQAEIQRLRLERERYEESMKKAFMRGVCALNMEALSMFQSTDAQPEHPPNHDQHDPPSPQDDPGSAPMGQPQPRPFSSTRFSPVHFDHIPPHGEAEHMLGTGVPMSRADLLPSTSVMHSSLPPGGTASSHKQVGGRVITASQQKPSKTVTARVTMRPDVGKAPRSNLQVMGVAPPMSSVVIERHHPVTQLTIGPATAAKFPRSSQQVHSSARGRGSSRAPATSTCQVHSIKVIE